MKYLVFAIFLLLSFCVLAEFDPLESSLYVKMNVSGNSLSEDTTGMAATGRIFSLWDDIYDSVVTRKSDPFYVGATLSELGTVQFAITAGSPDTSHNSDTLVLGLTIEYGFSGISPDGKNRFTFWYEDSDTLFWFEDTLFGAGSIIQDSMFIVGSDTTREWFDSLYYHIPTTVELTDTTSDLSVVVSAGVIRLVNTLRFVTYWPDNDYLQTYHSLDKREDNLTNVFVNAVFLRADFSR